MKTVSGMRIYEKGEKVWVYDCPCEPRLGTIIDKVDSLDAYQVEHKEGRDKLRLYSGYKLYKYPDDLHLMICNIKDDINHLDRIVGHLEEFSWDLQNPNNPIAWVE